jgi:hypothetical protein
VGCRPSVPLRLGGSVRGPLSWLVLASRTPPWPHGARVALLCLIGMGLIGVGVIGISLIRVDLIGMGLIGVGVLVMSSIVGSLAVPALLVVTVAWAGLAAQAGGAAVQRVRQPVGLVIQHGTGRLLASAGEAAA